MNAFYLPAQKLRIEELPFALQSFADYIADSPADCLRQVFKIFVVPPTLMGGDLIGSSLFYSKLMGKQFLGCFNPITRFSHHPSAFDSGCFTIYYLSLVLR